MVQSTQLRDVSLKALRVTEETLRDIPRVVISAEERLNQRVRSILRVTVATLFFGISGLISLGANVTMAFAKKVSPDHSVRVRRSKVHLRSHWHFRPLGKVAAPDGSANHSTVHHKALRTEGIASWYGGKFHNRKTASGKKFDKHSLTAAHRTLPFGTRVRVTNLSNHKTCVVEITDRGPYVHKRLIDVSQGAAQELGMATSGTARVELEVLSPTTTGGLDIAGVDKFELLAAEPQFDHLPQFPTVSTQALLNQTVPMAEAVAEP